jgi:putative lipase involved disintegration of autophagic bodies
MKRVVIFRLFVLLIVTISAICICKYGFYKKTKVSFPNKIVEVWKSDNNYYLKIPVSANSETYYRIDVTKEQANCFLRNN